MPDNASFAPSPKPEVLAKQMAELMSRIASNRDRRAFAHVFDFYAPRIKGFLIKNNCTPVLAEEVTQDVMMTLWQKAYMFDPAKASLGTWLFRIARNRRIDLIRRDKSGELDAQDPTMFPAIDEIDTEDIDARERDRRVRIAILALPTEQMQLIRLSFFEGQPHSQIAEDLNLPLGTVKSRIRLAFNRLRKKLSEDNKVNID